MPCCRQSVSFKGMGMRPDNPGAVACLNAFQQRVTPMSMDEPQHASYQDDEIDLRDLALMLIEGWYWIIGTVVAAVIVAFAYLAVTSPTYSTSLTFTRAADGLRTLNSMPGISYTEDQVVLELSRRLASYENFSRFMENSETGRENFINAMEDVADEKALFVTQRRFFSDNLVVSHPDEETPLASLELTYNDRLVGPDFVNGYYRCPKSSIASC